MMPGRWQKYGEGGLLYIAQHWEKNVWIYISFLMQDRAEMCESNQGDAHISCPHLVPTSRAHISCPHLVPTSRAHISVPTSRAHISCTHLVPTSRASPDQYSAWISSLFSCAYVYLLKSWNYIWVTSNLRQAILTPVVHCFLIQCYIIWITACTVSSHNADPIKKSQRHNHCPSKQRKISRWFANQIMSNAFDISLDS